MKAAPSSCRVSTKRMSPRPCISVTMLLVVEPTTPKVYSTPSARNASRTAALCTIGLLLDHPPNPAVPRVVWSRSLREVPGLHLGQAIGGELGEFKESLQVARDHALDVRWHRPELPEVRRADVVQPRGVQTEHVPLVGFADLRVVPLLSYLLRNLEPPERLDLPLRGTIPEGIGAEVDPTRSSCA